MAAMRFRGPVAALLALSLASAPAAAEAPAKPGAPSKDDEHRAEIFQTWGQPYASPITAYVTRVGDRMAEAAGQGGRCRFTVLDSDVVNAFARPPGCDIYITRALLGLIRSEDELAAVLGHEVGHVAANHAGRRQTTSVLTGLGALVLGAVTGSSALANIASQAGQLGVLSYSRGQEFEADSLGEGYLVGAGYDPYGLADMLSALQSDDQLEALGRAPDAQEQPGWSRTHPLTGDRIARAVEAARRTGVAPGARPQRVDPYLDQADGLLYGDNPSEGVVLGRRFLHPDLGVGFTAPAGFTLTNSPKAVGVRGPGGQQALFGAGPPGSEGRLREEAYAVLRQVAGNQAYPSADAQSLRVGGVEGVTLWAQAQSDSGAVELNVAVFAVGQGTLHFVTLAPLGRGQGVADLVQSFHRLTDEERAEARPRLIKVVAVKPGETVADLASRMAVAEHPREVFEAINGLQPGDTPKPGDRVKLVVLSAR
jgi:predicted Zn-dependent protease